jgi:hypothetical protein
MRTEVVEKGVYILPGVLGLAIGSGRGEITKIAIRQTQSGEIEWNKDSICEVLRLLGDLLNDGEALRLRVEELEDLAEESREGGKR